MSGEDAGFEVRLEPSGLSFRAPVGLSVLEAAQKAGIRMPRSCRNGTCRACLCRAESGSVTYRIEWPGLSADEEREGYLLPCVALAATDLALDAPGAVKLEPPAQTMAR